MKRNNIVDKIQDRDLEQLYQIIKQVFNNESDYEKIEKNYKLLKENKDIHLLGYYIDDELVGTVILNVITLPSGKEATIWDVAVKEEYRRLGIASKLMIRAEEIARTYDDISRIWLFSGFHRTGAHELYRKLGYDENKDKAFIKEIK